MEPKIVLLSIALCLMPALWAVDMSQRDSSVVVAGAATGIEPPPAPFQRPESEQETSRARQLADIQAEFSEFETPEALNSMSAAAQEIAP